MHKYPSDLLRVEALDADGKEVYRRPLWLIVFGKQRQQLDAKRMGSFAYCPKSSYFLLPAKSTCETRFANVVR